LSIIFSENRCPSRIKSGTGLFRITLGDRQAANYASAELEKKFPDGVALFPRLMLAAVVREKSEQQLFRAARSATSDGLNRMLPD
jgi:hypothetical protein